MTKSLENFNELLTELTTRGCYAEYTEIPTADKFGQIQFRGGLAAYVDPDGEMSLEWDNGDVVVSDALDYILFYYDDVTN